ncbi:hypothetical protein TNCV_5063231 [Trichonephila clavipes]|nr:hypothetical protein TNCV_5063231 [Trichonephila clavipes]
MGTVITRAMTPATLNYGAVLSSTSPRQPLTLGCTPIPPTNWIQPRIKEAVRGHPRNPSEGRERTGGDLKSSLRVDTKKLLPPEPQYLDSNNLVSLITSMYNL